MAKRADSKYLSGARTDNWLKIKTSKRQEVVIAGFTAPRRTRPYFGALTLALREGDGWRYIGHVGTGFSHEVLEELHGKLIRLKVAKSPFGKKTKDEAVTSWVKPQLVAEVKFTEWTSSGGMRHPVYLGLREDKRAEDVTREREEHRADKKRAGLAPEIASIPRSFGYTVSSSRNRGGRIAAGQAFTCGSCRAPAPFQDGASAPPASYWPSP